MTRLLFICAGNICRSPMAEAVFRHLAAEAGLADHFEIDSAGTGGWHLGELPHPKTRAILEEQKISYDGQQARQIQQDDIEHYDYLVVMDSENYQDVAALARQAEGAPGELVRLLDFADPQVTNGLSDVPDPYYVGGYDAVYTLVRSGCQGLLRHIQQAEDLPGSA
jgi:protein-tyrosine phosphatase